MKICFISVEFFAWGKYGGFGRATRAIGRELVKRGHTVCAVVPRRKGQQRVEVLDGITVYSFPLLNPFAASNLFRVCDADVYHSQEPSLSTYLAMKAMPRKKHVITFQNTRLVTDWINELNNPSLDPFQVLSSWLYEDNWYVTRAVKKADRRYCAASVLLDKSTQKYGLANKPEFLATPIDIPLPEDIHKASRPTVCFVARWDRIKRPQLFFRLAEYFPDVRFIAVGQAQNANQDARLRQTYGSLPNVEMTGFIDQFASDKLTDILNQSWILINTSVRETLPVSFIEALSHKCALLSGIDTDAFTSRFGLHVEKDRFQDGLRYLLAENRWKACGERGYNYVRERFSLPHVIDQHAVMYKKLCG